MPHQPKPLPRSQSVEPGSLQQPQSPFSHAHLQQHPRSAPATPKTSGFGFASLGLGGPLQQAALQQHAHGPGQGQQQPVKVAAFKKAGRDISHVRQAQVLRAHEGVIWAAAFSRDGRYLATAGQDCVVMVWEVLGAAGAAAAQAQPPAR